MDIIPPMAGKRNSGKTITIRDVAKTSGFSATTVSIVLNNAPLARYIPQTTKTRIQSAAKKLGYHPNIFAKSLRSRRNHTVGVMVFDITDPYCTLILRGIENSLYQASFMPILADAHNERPRFERYVEMLLERRVEGLIIVANWLLIDINLLADLEKSDIPTVVIGREMQSKSISSIIVDDEGGAYAALGHLYALGHRKIAFVRGPRGLLSSKNRWRGVQRFAHDTGLEIDPKMVVDLPEQLDPNLGVPDGYRMTEEILKKRRNFTALMAFDDMTALGAMRALIKAGMKVPEQCSLIHRTSADGGHGRRRRKCGAGWHQCRIRTSRRASGLSQDALGTGVEGINKGDYVEFSGLRRHVFQQSHQLILQ